MTTEPDPRTDLILMLADSILTKGRLDLQKVRKAATHWNLGFPWNKEAREYLDEDIRLGEDWCNRLAALIERVGSSQASGEVTGCD